MLTLLRALVLALALLNGGYWAWSQGWLGPWGLAPHNDAEPQRLQEQVQAQALRLLTPEQWQKAQAALLATRQAASCYEAGPFGEPKAAVLREALAQVLPGAERWSLQAVTEPARWIVYSGKFSNPTLMAHSKRKLEQLGFVPQPLTNPALQPGFSLGSFAAQAEAQVALAALTTRGVRALKIVQERPAQTLQLLRLPALQTDERERVQALEPLAGMPLRPCTRATNPNPETTASHPEPAGTPANR